MSGTTASPVCTIDQTGITAPAFADVLNYLTEQYLNIYGQDTYLGADSQDMQWIGVIAALIHDVNSTAVAVYQAFSPATAQGAGLSSVVKINNIRRLTATNSTVDVLITGQGNTPILNGIVRDSNQNNWLLPASVLIDPSGQVTVTAVAANPGSVEAAASTVTTILTPTRGWQQVTNPAAAVPGDPVESDAALRFRQAVSTALPSQSVLDGMVGAVASVPGVLRYAVYENDTSNTDVNGIPAHAVAFVVDGGDASDIAQAIFTHKTIGSGTYGTTTIAVLDVQAQSSNINFFRPSLVAISVNLVIQPLTGFVTTTEANIIQAIVDYISALPIGADVYIDKVYAAANLVGVSKTYRVVMDSIGISRSGTPTSQDVVLAFNEAAICTTDNVVMTTLVH